MTKKNLSRIVALLLCVLMFASMLPAIALAEGETPPTEEVGPPIASPEPPQILATAVDVKSNASEQSIKDSLRAKFEADFGKTSSFTWTTGEDVFADETITADVVLEDGTVMECSFGINLVEPDGYALKNEAVKDVLATDSENRSATSLLSHVNSDREIICLGDKYNAAHGEAPELTANRFAWTDCDEDYLATGDSYTFAKDFTKDGITSTLVRTVMVHTVVNSMRNLAIDYDDNTINTTANMKWSLDRSSWKNCTNNMSIRDNWMDEVVYFYIPETQYTEATEIVSLYVPPKADTPDVRPEPVATVHTITITNCWDYDYAEFSVNGEIWRSTRNETLRFSNLKPNTRYTVYVRTEATPGVELASDYISTTVTTGAEIKTEIDTEQYSADNYGYIDAVAIVAPEVDDDTVEGTLTATDLRSFNNIVDSYVDRFNNRLYVTMNINHYMEEPSVTPEVNESSFKIGIRNLSDAIRYGHLEMTYNSDFAKVYIDSDATAKMREKNASATLTISLEEVESIANSTNLKWLREALLAGAPVYDFSVTTGTKNDVIATFTIPYRLDADLSVSAIRLYHVSNDGKEKTAIDYEYNEIAGEITFTTNLDGRFVVLLDETAYMDVPFEDVTRSDWFYDYVAYCYDRGLFKGTSETKFAPYEDITRAMIVTLLARLDGYDTTQVVEDVYFTDVESTYWYAAAAQWAYDEGLITGREFNAEESMKREDIALLLYKYFDGNDYDVSYNKDDVKEYLDDKDITHNNKRAIYFLRSTEIMEGKDGNTFAPDDSVTRAEMAAIMQRVWLYMLNTADNTLIQ